MKLITKKEWEDTPEDYKRNYSGSLYMLYKEVDGSTYFGPVKIKSEDHIVDFKKPYPACQIREDKIVSSQ